MHWRPAASGRDHDWPRRTQIPLRLRAPEAVIDGGLDVDGGKQRFHACQATRMLVRSTRMDSYSRAGQERVELAYSSYCDYAQRLTSLVPVASGLHVRLGLTFTRYVCTAHMPPCKRGYAETVLTHSVAASL